MEKKRWEKEKEEMRIIGSAKLEGGNTRRELVTL
jgi:hypothetical protein